jgi:uncharacterized protein
MKRRKPGSFDPVFFIFHKFTFRKKKMVRLNLILILTSLITAPGFSQEMPEGMKQYTFVMLKKGPNRTQDAATVQEIQKGHLAHMGMMAEKHQLNIAGPFLDDGFWRGILIFSNPDTAAVKQLIEMDPAVESGRLAYEIHPWMGKSGTKLE